MAEYYLRRTDDSYVYRITYRQDGGNTVIDGVHVCGTGFLPDGSTLTIVDQPSVANNIVVDQVMNRVTAATVAEYRTAAKAMVDLSWT